MGHQTKSQGPLWVGGLHLRAPLGDVQKSVVMVVSQTFDAEHRGGSQGSGAMEKPGSMAGKELLLLCHQWPCVKDSRALVLPGRRKGRGGLLASPRHVGSLLSLKDLKGLCSSSDTD